MSLHPSPHLWYTHLHPTLGSSIKQPLPPSAQLHLLHLSPTPTPFHWDIPPLGADFQHKVLLPSMPPTAAAPGTWMCCPSPKGGSVRGGMWTSLPVLCLQPSPAVCEKRTNRTFNLPRLCTRPAMAGAARELSDALVALQRSQDSKGRVTDCILALGSCVGQTAV